MNIKSKAVLCLLVSLCYIISAQVPHSNDFHNRYTLSEVVVFSRHNIRAPLSGKGSELERITPHQWYSWSSGPSHLSLKGGVMETMMGQYFHEWLVKEGLFMEDSTSPYVNIVAVYMPTPCRELWQLHIISYLALCPSQTFL